MITTRTVLIEVARTLFIVAVAVLVVYATEWALQGLPKWVVLVYLVGLSTAGVAMSLYLREMTVDEVDWDVDYRDWREEREDA